MTNLFTSIREQFNYKTLLLYLSLCSVMLLKVYFDRDGCISPDSTYYLRLSQNLLSGDGFRIADYTSPDGKSFFSIWPVGYPIMIFTISKLTGLGVVWASKVLNLLVMGIILLLFRYIFKKNVHWVGLLFFVDSFFLIFTYTWSEAPFLIFLILISISLYKCVETSGALPWLAALFFAGIAMFLTRYIGLFSVSIIGFVAIISLFKRKWQFSIKLLIVAFLQLVFAGFYLYHNLQTSGHLTGMQRDLPKESNLELLKQLFIGLKEEFIVIKCGIPLTLSFLLLLLLGIYLYLNRGKSQKGGKLEGLWLYFLLAGLLYYGSMIGAKWFSNFTPLDYRYLFPGTFMLMLSLATYLQGRPGVKIMKSPLLYFAILITLTIHYLPNSNSIIRNGTDGISYFQKPNYINNTRKILERYKEVKPKSVVLFGSIHLRYLRDDIIPTEIYNKSTYKDMIAYFSQKKGWNVYFNITDNLDSVYVHDSFIRFMESNKDRQIVKVQELE